MSVDWISPVVTGVIRAVGVAGTYWTARHSGQAAATLADDQRDAAREDRTHNEKREAYVALLEAVSVVRQTLHDIRQTTDHDARTELGAQALAPFTFARERVRLTGPVEVRDRAKAVGADVLATVKAVTGDSGSRQTLDNVLIDGLLAAMKKDLGYELAPEDVESLALASADSLRTEDEW